MKMSEMLKKFENGEISAEEFENAVTAKHEEIQNTKKEQLKKMEYKNFQE